VIARLEYYDAVTIDEINQSMFFIDSSRPAARQYMSEWFGFSDSLGWAAHRFLKEAIQSLEYRLVVGLPIEVVLPTEGSEDESH
jgi:hypothetical protein